MVGSSSIASETSLTVGKIDKYNAIKWEDFVYYDETSPTFLRWSVDRISGRGAIRKAAGDVAGGIYRGGYSSTGLFGKLYLNHRIIWVLFNGWVDPELDIDHIDGDSSNNRIDNLRLVTNTTNRRNMSSYCKSATGVTGVNFRTGYYTAKWCPLNGKRKAKYFSISKLGEEEAFRLACEYRQQMIEELNEQGAGYSDRHGT